MEDLSTGNVVRKRRTRAETRELLLAAAVKLVENRVVGTDAAPVNPMADVLVTDVLEEANRSLKEADSGARPMTTGAVYNIWPSQADFQSELVERILDEAATPGIDKVRAVTLDGLARRLPWQDVLATAIEIDYLESFEEPAMFIMIGMAALSAPGDVAAAERLANERYVRETGELLGAIVRYAGRELRPGRTMEDLVWAIEALEAGYLLRKRIHPDIPLRPDADGVSALATAAVGVVESFTTPGRGEVPSGSPVDRPEP